MARRKYKNSRRIGIAVAVCFLTITIFAGTFAAIFPNLRTDIVTPPSAEGGSSSEDSSPEEEPSSQPDDESQDGESAVGDADIQDELENIGWGDDQDDEDIDEEAVFARPDEMRAAYLIPGEDFLKTSSTSANAVKKEIDAAIASAVDYKMNSVIVDLRYNEYVIYSSELYKSKSGDFDILNYIIEKAEENNLYVYAIYEALNFPEGKSVAPVSEIINGDTLDVISNSVKELVGNYNLNGVIIESYFNEKTETAYSQYMDYGMSIGFDNYMYQNTQAVVKTISDTIRKTSKNTQIGISTTSVWANSSALEGGSKTNASYQMLYDGYADVKTYIEDGYVDFISLKASGSITDASVPFIEVVKWWSKVALENEMPLYVVHSATKVGSDKYGWKGPDQLTRQVLEARKIDGYTGSIFNSLESLKKDPDGSTTTLMNYYDDKVNEAHILKDLAVTEPTKKEFTTYEPSITFKGASDPTFKLTVNGKELEQDENGYFSYVANLKAGENEYTFEHKGKTVTYKIRRNVQVFKEVYPTGAISAIGGSKITVTAVAYKGAKVNAKFNGQTITLKEDEALEDSDIKDSNYVRYTGVFSAPAATSAVQNLGKIVFSASAEGITQSESGASVRVNKAIIIDEGDEDAPITGETRQIKVSAASAETFPINTLDDYSDPDYHPLPKGTIDMVVGDKLVFSDGKSTFDYYILASGVRVYADDVSFISEQNLDKNNIKKINVGNKGGYTTVSLTMDWAVPYTVSLSSNEMRIKFKNTDNVPTDLPGLSKNPLFSSANWSGSTLVLKLKTGFMGYRASYNSNVLTFKFTNPAPIQSASNSYGYTLNGARIVLDPGHNDKDPGAIGFYPNINEREINRAVAQKTKEILESLGATVQVNSTPASSSLKARMNSALAFNPHVLISIHCNAAANSSASGTEGYYFNSFSRPFADSVSSSVASSAGFNKRNTKFAYYYMTRNFAFPATLTEYGFVTNQSDYGYMASSEGQEALAEGTVKGIIKFFKANYTGGSSGDEGAGAEDVAVTGITLENNSATIKIGAKLALKASVQPENATNKQIIWTSSDETVATVDENGVVTAKKVGSVTITAQTKEGGFKKTATIKVIKPTEEETKVAGVELNKTSVNVEIGGETQLTAEVLPETAIDKTVKWSTSDSSIATVDANGKVKGVKEGKATITVTTNEGGFKATATVNVVKKLTGKEVTGVKLSKTSASIDIGSTIKLTANILPETAEDTAVRWESSDKNVATVSGGKVTGVKEGTAVIKVTTRDGGYTAECTVTVTKKGGSSSSSSETSSDEEVKESIEFVSETMNLINGEEFNLYDALYITPENAEVTWAVRDKTIVSIDEAGVITGLAEGETEISATIITKDGQKLKAFCTITVI